MLNPTNLIRTEYILAHDLLALEWPSHRALSAAEFEYAAGRVTQAVQQYDIGLLLVEAPAGRAPAGTEPPARAAAFLGMLSATRLRRVAWVTGRADGGGWLLGAAPPRLPFLLRAFSEREAALGWLKG